MASLNKVQIIGNLGADPEMRFTANGRAVTTLRVAVNRSYTTQDGERREETEWVRVVAWARLAEQASQYLAKGRSVYVEGRLSTREWEDKEGQRRFTTEVVAQDIQFLDRRGGGDYDGDSVAAPAGASVPGTVDPDDLPFE
jgi:single-strand DNA-binding protein